MMFRPRQAPPDQREVQAWLNSSGGFLPAALQTSYNTCNISKAPPQFTVHDLVAAPHTLVYSSQQELPQIQPPANPWAQWADEQPCRFSSVSSQYDNLTRQQAAQHHVSAHQHPASHGRTAPAVDSHTARPTRDTHAQYGYQAPSQQQPQFSAGAAQADSSRHRQQPQQPPATHYTSVSQDSQARQQPVAAQGLISTRTNTLPQHNQISGAPNIQTDAWDPWSQLLDERDASGSQGTHAHNSHTKHAAPKPTITPQQPQQRLQLPNTSTIQTTTPIPPIVSPHQGTSTSQQQQQQVAKGKLVQTQLVFASPSPHSRDGSGVAGVDVHSRPAAATTTPLLKLTPVTAAPSWPAAAAAGMPCQAQHPTNKPKGSKTAATAKEKPSKKRQAAPGADAPDVDVAVKRPVSAWPASVAPQVPSEAGAGSGGGGGGGRRSGSGVQGVVSKGSGRGSGKVDLKAAAGLRELSEALDLPGSCVDGRSWEAGEAGGMVIDVSQPQGLTQLQQQLATAQAVVLGVVYSCSSAGAATQYYCSAQPGLTRPQQQMLRKARNIMAKIKPPVVTRDDTDGFPTEDAGSSTWDTQLVGMGMVCCQPSSQPHQAHTTTVQQPNQPLFYLPVQSLITTSTNNNTNATTTAPPATDNNTAAAAAWNTITQLIAGQDVTSTGSATATHASARTASHTTTTSSAAAPRGSLFTPGSSAAAVPAPAAGQQQGSRPLVICPNSKAFVREMLQAGLPLPEPVHDLQLVDPCVLAWLADPHLKDEGGSGAQGGKELSSYEVVDLLDYHQIGRTAGGAAGGAGAGGRPSGGGTSAAGSGGGGGSSILSQVLHSLPPLQRLRHCLLHTPSLVTLLTQRTRDWLPQRAVALEMQVSLILGMMEARGVGLSTQHLTQHAQRVSQRITELKHRAEALAGRAFNPGSAAQLADVLYNTLKLQPPSSSGKTHASTDEATLKQLSSVHPLPAVILDYRCMTNLITKWLRPPWAVHAVRHVKSCTDGCVIPRVYCSWNGLATATGRLSSSAPNLQAVTKYTVQGSTGSRALGRTSGHVAPPTTAPTNTTTNTNNSNNVTSGTAGGGVDGGGGGVAGSTSGQPHDACDEHVINVRDAFVAQPGCVLISADYSQIELRVLAHLSGDPQLTALLHKAGAQGDVFQLIAASWLKPSNGDQARQQQSLLQGVQSAGGVEAPPVSKEEREVAKRIVYGILYGLTAYGLQQQLSGYGLDVPRAQQLIKSFLSHFSGVAAYIERCNHQATQLGYVTTLTGRRRPLPGLSAPANSKVAQEARRRVVNSIVQGSAADLIKLAMLHWEEWAHGARSSGDKPHTGVPRLVAQVHDELVIECPAEPDSVNMVAGVLSGIMSGVLPCTRVPLSVNLYQGRAWGELTKIDL